MNNTETDELNLPETKPQLSREELEKKYFKNNVNFYTNKEQETNFEQMTISEKDFQILRSQMGDQEEGIPPPDAEEPIQIRSEGNNVDMQEIRNQVQQSEPSFSLMPRLKVDCGNRMIILYAIILVNTVIFSFSLAWYYLVNISLSLLATSISRIYMMWNLKRFNLGDDQMMAEIVSKRDKFLRIDIAILMWLPVRQIVLSIVFPHMNLSPINPLANESFCWPITVLFGINYLLMNKLKSVVNAQV